jgi:alpha-beta hydrolase superfamily lysophospholipase
MTSIAPATVLLATLALGAPVAAAEWSATGPATEVIPGIRASAWTLDVGGDRIGLHRYRGTAPAFAALLYLPGTNMNGRVAVAEEDHNLWLYLAKRGVDVYALDYRTHALGSADLDDPAVMKEWTMAAFVSDALAALGQARAESPGLPVFVAGFSRGVSLAFGVAGTDDAGELAGMVALDGPFKSHRPEQAADREKLLEALRASGQWASDVAGNFGWERRAVLMEAAAKDPQAPALEGDFPSVGDQLAQILYRAWRPGGLANAVHGFSDPAVLARLLADYDRYYPAVQTAEGNAIADWADDPGTPLDDAWGELELPILAFASSGMGNDWVMNAFWSATASGSADVSLHLLEGYGHLDVIVGEHARRDVFEPALEWLRSRAAR